MTLFDFRLNFTPSLPANLGSLRTLKAFFHDKLPLKQEVEPFFSHLKEAAPVSFQRGEETQQAPLKVGIVFSGGQAAGGHNVAAGLFDALKELNSSSRLFGFLNGPGGIVKNEVVELTASYLQPFRNQGGFDLIGSGRTKIETEEQFQKSLAAVRTLGLNGLVVVGGDDSNTNAALLAEYFLKAGQNTCVVGVPKTIDGDLKNSWIETSFGFDSASKTYSEMIGNIQRDALSAKKYYYFIRLMGRSASHIALECALQTHPNYVVLGEEVAEKKWDLTDIISQICDLICQRAEKGKNYGTLLIPEGLIEFIPSCKLMLKELNYILAKQDVDFSLLANTMTAASFNCYKMLPHTIQMQLLLDRDPHGNVQVSKIETERLLIDLVEKELKERSAKGTYREKFSAQPLFFGYEGRSCYPSNFDCNYCETLGRGAALLVSAGLTGYMATVTGLTRPTAEWEVRGVPLAAMIGLESRKGEMRPVIEKSLVDLAGSPFKELQKNRVGWALHDSYRYPGPIQFFGPKELTDSLTYTLVLESGSRYT